MRTWSEIQTDPAYHGAAPHIQEEVRGAYRKHLESDPHFKGLPTAEQERMKREIEGDPDFAVKMAAALIAGAKKNELDRALLAPEKDDALIESVKGAKTSEHFLDIPLKDRQREPFSDSLPGHLDKPLRSLLAFIDDGLPEYNAFKFWDEQKNLSLAQKIHNVQSTAQQSGLPNQPIDLDAAIDLKGYMRDRSELMAPLRKGIALPPKTKEKLLLRDPQSAAKFALSDSQWETMDKIVLGNILAILKTMERGIPAGLRTDAIPAIISGVRKVSYELLARRLNAAPADQTPVPVDPEKVAVLVMAARVFGPEMDDIAAKFPSLFSFISGLSVPPRNAVFALQQLAEEMKRKRLPLMPETFLTVFKSGEISYRMIGEIETRLRQESAKEQGANPDIIARLEDDLDTAAEQPFMAALVVATEAMVRQDLAQAKAKARQKIAEEVKRALTPPKPPEQDQESPPDTQGTPATTQEEPEDVYPPTAPPIDGWDEETENSPPTPQMTQNKAPDAMPDTSGKPQTTAPAAPGGGEAPKVAQAAKKSLAGPIHAYLATHPISQRSIKKAGLSHEFEPYSDITTKDGDHE
jgi:hypothetical protein